MDSWVISMMLGASVFLGTIALIGFLWAVKNGQFDDEEKFLNATKFDGEDELNDAANLQRKKEELKKSYRPEQLEIKKSELPKRQFKKVNYLPIVAAKASKSASEYLAT